MKPTILVSLVLVIVSALAAANLRSSADDGPKYLNLPGRTDDRPFCHAVLVDDTAYIAGTLGLDPETGAVPDDVEEEIRFAMDGIKAKLALAEMTMDDVVSVQIFCPDLELYGAFNAVYRTYFEDHFPARSFIGSGPLLRGARFEINAVAARD